MRRMTFVLIWSTCFVSGLGAEPATHELRIAALAPERSAWGKAFRSAADELAEQTDGQVKLKLYLGGIQGDERTVLRKMRVGQLHGAALMGQGLSVVCPDGLALSLPLLFDDHEEADAVFDGTRPGLEKRCRENGYEALVWPQIGFSYLFSQDRVTTVEALRASKPWLMEDDVLSASLYEAIGVTPVPTAVGNVLTGLQTGLVRTIFSPPAGLIALQWHTRVKYRLDLKIGYSFGVLVISKRSWDGLSAELQGVMRSLLEKRNAELNREIRVQNADALSVIEKHGIETITAAAGAREELLRATEKVGESLAGKSFSREVLEKVNALRAEYRKKRGSR